LRYVLALLLLRRRVLRLEDSQRDEQGEVLVLNCPRDESLHHVLVRSPGPQRTQEIEAELAKLLAGPAP
jgi:hypothetical protein